VFPRLDLTSEKKVSVLKPSFKRFGRKGGSLHVKCIRGVRHVSASIEGINCVVALRVYLVASWLRFPKHLLHSLIVFSL
jgi:hypothetical protein